MAIHFCFLYTVNVDIFVLLDFCTSGPGRLFHVVKFSHVYIIVDSIQGRIQGGGGSCGSGTPLFGDPQTS